MTDLTDESDTSADLQRILPAVSRATSHGQREGDLLQRQEAIVAIGRRAIAPPELPVLMQDAAAMLAELLGTQHYVVAEFSPDGASGRLRLALHDTQRAEAGARSVYETSTAGCDSLAGYALQMARPVVVSDVPRDERFTDVFLLKHGIQSAVAVPLRLQDRSFGSLLAGSRETRDFREEDLLFVETVAHLVTSAIGRSEAEKSLADERRLASGVLQTVDALVLMLDDQGQIVCINPACERITGFSLHEIKGRPVWNVFCVPKEVDRCRRLLEELRESKAPVEYESHLLTKHAQQRQIAWSCSAIAAGDGSLEWIIATGVDVTGQRQAEDEAQRSAQAAEQARRTLARTRAAAERQGVQLNSATDTEKLPADGAGAAEGSAEAPSSGGIERRGHPRRSFPYNQRIAAVVDGRLPDRQTFTDVPCFDISASGFSFHSRVPPASDTLVVALGAPPKVAYLVAQVAHVTRVEKRGERKFLIGCNYVGRAAY